MQAILTAGLHIGRDCSSIVIRFHDDQAMAEDHQGRQKPDGRYRLQPIRMRVESEYCL
jgi:hypothetical protein